MRALRHLGVLVVLGAAVAVALSCSDPVHDAEVAALGPENPKTPPGPQHRPGQPCLTCHGGLGPAGTEFVTAGTVYLGQYTAGTSTYPAVEGGLVHLVDANGKTYDTKTNAAGNFYVTTSQWSPTFPLGAVSEDAGTPMNGCIPSVDPEVAYAGQITVAAPTTGACKATVSPMFGPTGGTAIDRGGAYASCSYCHFDPPSTKSVGHVYILAGQ